ncbi:MAG: PDZ domain-containing protein [Planctomycetaceae bacterium]|nr:PDZ domain-containing protein [Planctomycetaceae bacterium]
MNGCWKWAALGCVAVSLTANAHEQDAPAPKTAEPGVTFLNVETDRGDVFEVTITAAAAADAQLAVATEVRQVEENLDSQGVLSAAAERAVGKYWIGVGCEPVSESLRSQLGIEWDTGLLVNEVMDDSPAKAAGIQPHDVLVLVAIKTEGAAAQKQKLVDVSDLSKTVQAAELKPLTLVLIRKGKSQSVNVTPVERPQPQNFLVEFTDVDVAPSQVGDPKKVQILLQQLQQELGGGPQGVRMQLAAPVVVAAPPQTTYNAGFAVVGNGLPEGMTLTITKSGNNPARIEVKKGEGQVWGANENEIDTLPPEAQGMAKAALAGMSQPNFNIAVSPPKFWAGNMHFTPPGHPHVPGWSGTPHMAPPFVELHRQLAVEQSHKGPDHPDVQKLKAQIEVMHKMMPTPPVPPNATVPATPQEAMRNKFYRYTTEAKAAPKPLTSTVTPAASAATQQQQLEMLHKQIQELTAVQAKQAEAQQQQLRELQKALEKLAPKE